MWSSPRPRIPSASWRQAPLRQRAEAMLDTIIFGLTQSPAAIQRSLEKVAAAQIHPQGVVRAAVPV